MKTKGQENQTQDVESGAGVNAAATTAGKGTGGPALLLTGGSPCVRACSVPEQASCQGVP